MRAKRAFDLVCAVPAAAVALPIVSVLAVLLRVTCGSPVLFRQLRPGLHGRPFELLKLRTMTDRRDETGVLLPDAERLTGLGRFLRRWSLDELPELWNVLRGEMSLVGPRPLLMEYLPRYTREQARRHEVLPGITGLAQIKGRNLVSWEERFALDVWYVDHRSLRLDVLILLQTLAKVFAGEGVSQPGHATAAKFTGSAPEPPHASA
jgi:sugar transferase EpsL